MSLEISDSTSSLKPLESIMLDLFLPGLLAARTKDSWRFAWRRLMSLSLRLIFTLA